MARRGGKGRGVGEEDFGVDRRLKEEKKQYEGKKTGDGEAAKGEKGA